MGERGRDPDGKGILHPEGMRAARDLAAGIVHEINNVLGVVLGNTHLAKKNATDPVLVEKYVREIRAAAEEGRELMRQLGAIASEDPLRARSLSLNDLAANAVSDLRIDVDLDLARPDPMVSVDLWLAQESLGALAHFMADSSSVESLRVVTRVVGDAVALTFEDDGGSLSTKELRSLFAPFSKAERRPKPGIGLARLADLAARFEGHVVATNREPHGLRVVLTLPSSVA
jgi:signal transduction histidine kinase